MAGDFQTILSIDATKKGTTLASILSDRGALGQLFLADEYLVAANIMAEACDQEPRLLRPRYMLVCQALELYLKSFLLNCKDAAGELSRPPLNHDLARLLDRCLERVGSGQEFIGPEHQAVVRELGPAASMFYFRYGHRDPGTLFDAATIHVPLMCDALDACRALGNVVRPRVMSFPKEGLGNDFT